ncbi:hypothetical protein ACQKKX_12375 [Neorhizobium sp. NPDC001467]|uniref:hypothetical protein n=1 Tax=Neorhizobium sp. NPDC001467 TaxID=3390595 RepID=UPI003D008595
MRSSISSSKLSRWATVAVVSAAIICAATWVVRVQQGYAVRGELTEGWLTDVARVREAIYAAQPADKKTIWIVGGSNALFGINSALLSELTGYNVRNYALHASFHSNILYSQIRSKVKPGDIVVSSREFSVIDLEFGSKFDYSNFLGHFSQFADLSLVDTMDLFMKIPLTRWWDGLAAYSSTAPGTLPYGARKPVAALLQEREQGYGQSYFYTHAALTAAGDINIDTPMARAAWVDQPVTFVPDAIAAEGIADLQAWRARFEARGAKFFSIMPAVIENSSRQMIQPGLWQQIDTQRRQMDEARVPLHCDPLASTFSAIYRLDTPYHLNAGGARLRTLGLADCLRQEIGGQNTVMKPFQPQAMANAVAQRLEKQRENFGEGDLPYQRDLRALKLLAEALQRRYLPGTYPPTQPVEALATTLAVGPVPAGLAYFSDGTHFGLYGYSKNQANCTVIAANWPALILPEATTEGDLTRCYAFGYRN